MDGHENDQSEEFVDCKLMFTDEIVNNTKPLK